MFTDQESKTSVQFSAANCSYPDHLMHLQVKQDGDLRFFRPPVSAANCGLPWIFNPDMNGEKVFVSGGPLELPSHPAENLCLPNSQLSLDDNLGLLQTKPFPGLEKRFIIFDRSGVQTRLFFSPLLSPINNYVAAAAAPVAVTGFNFSSEEEVATPVIRHPMEEEEKWDENRLSDEESEDSDEIDALLFSDSDDESDEDEVTSTLQFFPDGSFTEPEYNKVEEEAEESFTGGWRKRQRLLVDGKFKSSSSSIGPLRDDAESANGDIHLSTREKKVKIREALKILETVSPECLSSNQSPPLAIIDKAIAYLKSMKAEAEALC
ncbi:hypothetical protein M569_03457 [Genlisea aurea]|uniref:BHLH domain-containing protein n=1 Tax=Genlisea aurea TaxID=192259 RepID=S8D1U6_9LAMI|nr:hypothetical protein M569_03457 [Genlisea aurea]